MFKVLSSIVLTVLLFAGASLYHGTTQPVPSIAFAAQSATQSLQLFATEETAQKHCPSDVVVWLNTASGIWHEKGMRWYGRTKLGAYVCRKEAAANGYRDTRNGQ